MANGYMKKMIISTYQGNTDQKTTMGYHLITVSMAYCKDKKPGTSAGEYVGKKEPYTLGGNID